MKIYISGAMTGVDEDVWTQQFAEATAALRAAKHKVISPAELDKEDRDKPWGIYLGRDLDIIKEKGIEAIVVLPGWEKSTGAHLEVELGKILGLKILRWPGLNDLGAYELPEGPIKRALPLVHGDRQKAYGHPAEDFARTAGMWKAMFGWDVNARDIPLAMIAIKLSRLRQSPQHTDSVTDLVGYAETYGMVIDRGV